MTTKKQEKPKDNNKVKEVSDYLIKEVKNLADEMRLPALNFKMEHHSSYDCNYADKDEDTLLAIRPSMRYKRCAIMFTDNIVKLYLEDKKDEIREALVHELCHLYTEEMFRLATDRYVHKRELIDATEELTETIAQYVRELIKLRNK
jgi:hypothetical protein